MNTKILTQYGTTSQDDRRWPVRPKLRTSEWNFFSQKNIQNVVHVHYLETSSLIKKWNYILQYSYICMQSFNLQKSQLTTEMNFQQPLMGVT